MSYDKPRLEMSDTVAQAIIKMMDGNPGAMRPLTEMAKNAQRVDPDDVFGPYGPLFTIDNLDFYGAKAYMLWNDLCQQDIVKTLAVLRANQFGFCNEAEIITAYKDRNVEFADAMLAKVQERLPNFGKA